MKFLWVVIITVLFLSCSYEEKRKKLYYLTPQDDIQDVINKSNKGDVILLSPGVYKARSKAEAFLVIRSKNNGITLRGTGFPENVVIDGDRKVLHVVFVDEGVDNSTVIENMTIRGGYAYPGEVMNDSGSDRLHGEIPLEHDFYHDGAGVMIYNASPIIRNVIIESNSAQRCGGGISVFGYARKSFVSLKWWRRLFGFVPVAIIEKNRIERNQAGRTGGGIDVYYDTKAIIRQNTIENNEAGKFGGGIQVLSNASAEILGNEIIGNRAHKGGGAIGVYKGARHVILKENCLVCNSGPDLIRDRWGHVEVRGSNFNEGCDDDNSSNSSKIKSSSLRECYNPDGDK
jgi:hypothetical protein